MGYRHIAWKRRLRKAGESERHNSSQRPKLGRLIRRDTDAPSRAIIYFHFFTFYIIIIIIIIGLASVFAFSINNFSEL